ncbi:MAG: hypothetical protein EBU46_09130 [Nitrosomonadaceae bacterium]|nr:hypothetical protein [Nitrosomonadaceae bacterium]
MPAFPFEQIKTSVNFDAGHVVQWKLSADYKGRPPICAVLQIAENESFETVIKEIPSATFYAVDDSRLKQNWDVNHVYRIKLIDSDDQITYSQPFNFDLDNIPRHKYLLASEIIRKEWVRLQYVGVSGWLLKRRHFGVEATQELDPVTKVPLTDNPISFGVGFNGGYYPAARFIYSQENRQQDTKLDEQGMGVRHDETVGLRCPGFPGVDVQDVVVGPDGKRWFVANVQERFFPGTHTTLIQEVQCRIIPNTDSVYRINVPE